MVLYKPPAEVLEIAQAALQVVGAPQDIAEVVAAHLIDADLAGVPSHGAMQVPRYVSCVKQGEIKADARPEMVTDRGAAVLVSGRWGFGHFATQFATDEAIARTRTHGVAMAGLIHAHHNGRLGGFVERAAAQDTALICWSGGQGRLFPQATPYGGSEPLFQSNPMAIGFPGLAGPSMMADFATTALAGGRIYMHHRAGKPLPPESLIRADGQMTTDAALFSEGRAWHVPFGGHKGFALMLACELLGSVLTGAWGETPGTLGGIYRRAGVLLLAVRADVFDALESVERAATDLGSEIRASRPRDGFDRVTVPGDPEAEARRRASAIGIPIEDDLWAELLRLAGLG